MNIIEKIITHKRGEVKKIRELYPVKLLEKSIYFETRVVSLCKYLQRDEKPGIIAEIKRKSPSKGVINEYVDIEQVSIGYMQAGASALSVLTDTKFFDGKNEDLTIARKFNFCPILRKDFIVDEYQIIETKSIGADAVLLIAAALTPERTRVLARFARNIGLEVLLEVHSEQEVAGFLNKYVNIIGVNNRNLKNFTTDITTSEKLALKIPNGYLKISESGISNPEAIHRLKQLGFDGFLIGEHFMQSPVPQQACMELIKAVENYKPENITAQ
jgi:indole-3-glycerol phosphate synthase